MDHVSLHFVQQLIVAAILQALTDLMPFRLAAILYKRSSSESTMQNSVASEHNHSHRAGNE